MVKVTAIKNWVKDDGNFENLGVKVKEYLPINDKLTLVHRILLYSTIEEDGIQKVNAVYKRLFYEIEMIRAYSNLDFSTIDKLRNSDNAEDNEKYSDKLTEYYDLIKSNGILDIVLGMIDIEEVRFIDECLREQIAENNRVNNSIAGVVGGALNRLIDRLPTGDEMEKLIQNTFTNLKNVDPKQLQFLSQAIGWNNGLDVVKGGK